MATNDKNNVSMLDLPLPILVDIFSRIPIKTILQFKCVCKTWLCLISDPYFNQIHLARSPLSLMILTKLPHRICTNSLVPLFTLNQDKHHMLMRLSLLTSCNGLICLHEFSYKQDSICVCNPILGEQLFLPKLESKNIATKTCGFGFGFNQSTNEYKVIQLQTGASSNKVQVQVHTIGTDLWRNIGDLPYALHQPYYGAFLNGALHWYAHSHDDETEFMCSFNLGNEHFQQFPGPSIPGYGMRRPVNSISVGVSRGFLYLCDGFCEPKLDIWLMKNYGVKESWTKEFVIVNPMASNLQRVFGSLHILNYRENMNMESSQSTEGNELLMLFGSENLLAYNVRSKSITRPKIQSNYQAIPYIPSLVSIKKPAAKES